MRRTILLSIVVALMLLPGCAQMKETLSGGSSPKQDTRPSPRYLDFNDILIPGELEKVQKESFIINGQGRLVLSGRVENESLAQFFITSMNSEGWASLNQYTFQGSIKLFFKKQEKIATILITEDPLSTRVEIWEIPQEKI
jgi:hypothetical protein